GAMTKIADLQEYRGGRGWVLDRVARLFATQQVRNMATLGGSIVWVTPWADFPVALLVLDSEMTLRGGSERVVSRAEFFSSQPHRLLRDGDILASVRVKRLAPKSGFGYRKTTRTHGDFSAATAAAAIELDGKVIKRVRVAVGAALPFPRRLTDVEKLLSGKALARDGLGENAFLKMVTDGTKGFEWKGSQGVSDEYAGRLAVVAARDAIAEAAMQALGAPEAQP
ncbi:MAG: FAD binding domain-containing protein, partial [Elusimicrobiota bacterium]